MKVIMTKKIKIELDEWEALWLKDMTRSPPHCDKCGKESTDDKCVRESLYQALEDAGV